MTGKTRKKKERKITNEKPVSLNQVGFKETLAALLVTKPPTKSKKKQTKKPSN